ncbi:MAG: hypothetical protein QG635_1708 [Bacteroidota bacterium]|nr:hypothetical protein [Bacteroidota bacterium]
MRKGYEKQYQEYYRLLDSQNFDVKEEDYSILNEHIPFLERLDVIDSSAIYIIDLYKRKLHYISAKFGAFFGYDMAKINEEGTDYIDRHVHPDDLTKLFETGFYFMKIAFQLPAQPRLDYKLIVDYRIQNAKGEYVRIIKQQKALELDRRGNIWLALVMVDIAPEQELELPLRSRLINIRTGELYRMPAKNSLSTLSNREKEILSLISKGMISRQIADKLFISVNTVNTHRQRIIEKLNVANTFEAIKYAGELGFIG